MVHGASCLAADLAMSVMSDDGSLMASQLMSIESGSQHAVTTSTKILVNPLWQSP